MLLRTLCLLVLVLSVQSDPARSDAPTAGRTPAPEPAGLRIFHDLRALAGRSTAELLRAPVFAYALERFLPDTVRSDTLYPGATVRDSVVLALSFPAHDLLLTGNRRFLVAQGCRSGECSASKGLVVADSETGNLCAILYHGDPDPADDRRGSARAVDRPVTRIRAEVYLPAPSAATGPLIEACATQFASATQRLVPSGYWVDGGAILARTAPDFRSHPEVAARFQPWDGTAQRY